MHACIRAERHRRALHDIAKPSDGYTTARAVAALHPERKCCAAARPQHSTAPGLLGPTWCLTACRSPDGTSQPVGAARGASQPAGTAHDAHRFIKCCGCGCSREPYGHAWHPYATGHFCFDPQLHGPTTLPPASPSSL
eukprot:190204-Chlamydomonas_euryale.AAC.2